MAAESRWSTTQPVDVTCPRCRLPLPTVAVRTVTRASGSRMLSVDVQVQELDAAWWRLARRGHPQCLPDDPRKVRRTGVAGFVVAEG